MSSIKQKKGYCPSCDNDKETYLIGGLCQSHYWQRRAKLSELKKTHVKLKPVRIAQVSKKQASKNREYLKVRLEFLNANQFCACCPSYATDVHHKKGREGTLLTDIRFFLPVCRRCHNYIEEHPEWAKRKGYSQDRLTI